MNKKEILGIIGNEIKWCKEHRMNKNDYEKGFIKGLRQAIFLITHALLTTRKGSE